MSAVTPLQQDSAGSAASLPQVLGWQGVVVRQATQALELVQLAGLPIELANVYKVSPLPPNVQVARDPSDPNRWQPTHDELVALPPAWNALEDSSCCVRLVLAICGGLNLRPWTMHFNDATRATPDRLQMNRPCKCGGACGPCCELRINTVHPETQRYLGQVREDCSCVNCFRACCCCRFYSRVLVNEQGTGGGGGGPAGQYMQVDENTLTHRYTIHAPLACCGPHNNCCGATCCNNDAVFDVEDTMGNVVANIQKTYAPGGSGCDSACCRCLNLTGNYIMSFPAQASVEERAVLLSAIFQIDYAFFEKKGGDQ